jgi:chromosome segregation ATPase
LGAEEYELLVSTLNKLPILKETLKKETEDLKSSRQKMYEKKRLVNELQTELASRDSKIKKIDSNIKEIKQKLEELDQVLADLEDNIKIEEEIFKPYSHRLDEANERLNRKKNSIWSNEFVRYIVYTVPMWVLIINWDLNTTWPESWFFAYCVGVPIVGGLGIVLVDSFEPKWNGATRKRDEVKSEWKKARGTLAGFEMKRGRNNKKKTKLVLEEIKLETEKGRLMAIDKNLKKRNENLGVWEKRVDGLVQRVESLEKEIEDGQNAIAPLIPYSNLLLDGNEE